MVAIYAIYIDLIIDFSIIKSMVVYDGGAVTPSGLE